MNGVAILVLGMHRSGTSALTWLLGQLGAALPSDAIEPTGDNARGYWESAAIVAADDQLLRVAQSSWFDPRALDLSRLPADALRSRRARIGEAITTAFGGAPLCAIKDPRQCRFVSVMRQVLEDAGYQPRAVLMLRSAAAIAASLAARDGTSPAYAHLLWLRHMIEAERGSRAIPRAIVDYDAMMADWRSVADRLATLIGHEGWTPGEERARAIDAFLDPSLRHHGGGPAALEPPLAGIVREVESGLLALATADDEAGRARLDAAYARFNAEPWLEGAIVHDELRHRRMPAVVDMPEDPVDASPAHMPVPGPPPAPSEAVALIRGSGLFDEDWYRAHYPDVAAGQMDPIEHYVAIGASEGRNPSPLFDTAFYARQMARRLTRQNDDAEQ